MVSWLKCLLLPTYWNPGNKKIGFLAFKFTMFQSRFATFSNLPFILLSCSIPVSNSAASWRLQLIVKLVYFLCVATNLITGLFCNKRTVFLSPWFHLCYRLAKISTEFCRTVEKHKRSWRKLHRVWNNWKMHKT